MSFDFEDNYLALFLAIIAPIVVMPEEALWVIRGKKTIFDIKSMPKRGAKPRKLKISINTNKEGDTNGQRKHIN